MSWAVDDLLVLVHSTIWALFFLSTIFLVLRFYSRLRRFGVGLHADDWVLLAGWVFILLASINMSWLASIFPIPGHRSKITLARVHHNLQSIALGLTKTSFCLTLLRLMSGGWEAKLIWAVMITMNLQFAVHIIAAWQAICGAPDNQAHIGGDACWTLTQSVTFTIFSALYSALCDFILALLPWKMIFNLQMHKSERIGIALALSMGVLAGITGVMKAVQGYKLINVRSPDYMYDQAVYWVWSMAEPNVTIISASIPVLRGFVRHVRNRTESSRTAGGYIKPGSKGHKFFEGRTVTAVRAETTKDQDGASDKSILGQGRGDVDNGGNGGGITWTTEVSVEYESRPETAVSKSKNPSSGDEFELHPIAARDHPGASR